MSRGPEQVGNTFYFNLLNIPAHLIRHFYVHIFVIYDVF